MRQEEKIKREKKKKGGGGKEGGLPPTKPSPTRFGGGVLPPWTRPTPLGLLEPQGKVPSFPPIYTEVLWLIYDDFSTAAWPHTSMVFPLDRVSTELGRSPAETRSSPTSGAPSRCRRTLLPLRLSCWIKKAEIIVELYVCWTRRCRPFGTRSWDWSRDCSRGGSRDVRTFHYINRVL